MSGTNNPARRKGKQVSFWRKDAVAAKKRYSKAAGILGVTRSVFLGNAAEDAAAAVVAKAAKQKKRRRISGM